MIHRERWLTGLFAAPAVILVAVLMYYPMVGTVIESLYATSFINPNPKFIGLVAYQKILGDPEFQGGRLELLDLDGVRRRPAELAGVPRRTALGPALAGPRG